MLIFYILFIFESENVCRSWGATPRERGTEELKWALCWQQQAQCWAQTHKLWDHDLSWCQMLNQLSHPGAPKVYLFLREGGRERERERERGRERTWMCMSVGEGKRESQAGSALSVWSPMLGSNSPMVRSWPELNSSWIFYQLSHPDTPIWLYF